MRDSISDDEVFCCTIFRSDGVGIREQFDITGLRDEATAECHAAAGNARYQIRAGSCRTHHSDSENRREEYQSIL